MIILDWQKLAKTTKKAQNKGNKIVFTNGCFDIIHAGHIQYLQEARMLGDILLVAVNSDNSVKRLKGPARPLVPEMQRCQVLNALKMVDLITVFNQNTPYDLIKKISPDVLVKGGDWQEENIVGADIVLKNGGRVESLSYKAGFSTSQIIEKVLKAYGKRTDN
ncbi:MAG: D-glycero-beta-D-manno-heptose 1-phosphate adenylyltransferase [Candidatus Cloacimonadota bacterium]|nr:D-glycero-beta-D-manno-heptose 1-phosphate adenylyltransferase [Candidatus Cloacimonadota bacterium]